MPEEEVTEEDYDRIFALNTKAQFFVAQKGYKHLPKDVSIHRYPLISSNNQSQFRVVAGSS
jgi:NAD(P)-dependent dehydrogenase (short-subunit alcohol dehydrogenase family)